MFGFKNILIKPQRPVIHGLFSSFRYLLWMIVEKIIILYLLIETGTKGSGNFTQNLIVIAKK